MRARRLVAARALWEAVRRARRPGAPGTAERLAALPRMIFGALTGRYPQIGAGRVVAMLGALLYLISPVDLIPELLLSVFGLADDALVAAWLAGAVLLETDRFLEWEGRRRRLVVGEVVAPGRAT